MDERLLAIRNWANHGTINQFKNEVMAKIGSKSYQAETSGNSVTFYRMSKSGGFLGIGARKVREEVLTVIKDGVDVRVPEDQADAAFVALLSSTLSSH